MLLVRMGVRMAAFIHILKLSVGTEDVADLAAWYASPRAQTADGLPRHITRMWPKREAEVTNGGSIYWIIKGVLTCRQRIIRFDEVTGADGIKRCAIVMDPTLVRVSPVQRQPFQGWRYLNPSDAPPDLTAARAGDDVLPVELSAALADIGVL